MNRKDWIKLAALSFGSMFVAMLIGDTLLRSVFKPLRVVELLVIAAFATTFVMLEIWFDNSLRKNSK